MPDLNDHDREYLRNMVRSRVRKRRKGIEALERKLGDEFDYTNYMSGSAFLGRLYKRLGGDPREVQDDLYLFDGEEVDRGGDGLPNAS